MTYLYRAHRHHDCDKSETQDYPWDDGRLKMRRFLFISVLGAVVGCSNGTGPTGKPAANVAVSFATQAANTPQMSRAAAPGPVVSSDDTLVTGSDTLVLTSVELVLREIELKPAEVPSCQVSPKPAGCQEFEAGPVLIALPLDGSVAQQFALDIPAGSYREVDFEIHKVSPSDQEDAAFRAAHPEFSGQSIRVTGTFNSQAFLYQTDLDVEQELMLVPPLEIMEGSGPTNLTIFVDLDGWFRDLTGALVDPDTGNKGGANESLINENIKKSLDAFEDEDRNGSR